VGGEILNKISNEGVIVAGGLLPEIKSSYFRIGHWVKKSLDQSLIGQQGVKQ